MYREQEALPLSHLLIKYQSNVPCVMLSLEIQVNLHAFNAQQHVNIYLIELETFIPRDEDLYKID
jgi:hypothetical protein